MDEIIAKKDVIEIIQPRLNSTRYGSLEWQRLYSILLEIKALPSHTTKQNTKPT